MASPQSSRAGLITTIVILAMFGLGVLVWGITENAGRRRAEEDSKAAAANYAKFTAANQTAIADVKTLQGMAASLNLSPNATVMEIIAKRNAGFAEVMDGSSNLDQAVESAKQEIANAMQTLQKIDALKGDINSSKPTVKSAVDDLVKVLLAQQAAANSAQQSVKDAAVQLKAAQDAFEAAKTESAKQVDQARKDLDAARADAANQIATAQAQLKAAQDLEGKEREDATKVAQDDQVKIQRLEQEKMTKEKALKVVVDKLSEIRPKPGDNILRQPDGTITRVPADNIVYINLGIGDHIADGLTFEVYSAAEGIPTMANNEDALPIGKAAIEVIAIGQNMSKCRVVKLQPGAQLIEGDLIANLVYDKNTTYNFMIYGDFDIAHTGTPKNEDGEILKRLVTTWGGKLSGDNVTIDTDFLVLGEEPKVPPPAADDDAPGKALEAIAKAKLEAYQKVLSDAKDLSIPVLNQNRFLYFIGYYDLATR